MTLAINGSFPSAGLKGLPEEVWCDFLEMFRRWVEPTTDSSFEYIFAVAMQTLGLAMGRSVSVSYGSLLYPNFYFVLVGPPGRSRKTTIVSRGVEVIAEAFDSDLVRVARGAGSGPGLLELFTSEEMVGGQRILLSIPGQRVLLDEPELTGLLKKIRRPGTSDLLEMLLVLYDGGNLAPRTRNRPITVQQPFFSMITTTTPQNLEANMTPLDIESGLFPRTCLIYGVERPSMPYPRPIDTAKLAKLAGELQEIQRHAEKVRKYGPLTLDGDVLELWHQIFYALEDKERDEKGPASAMLQRIPAHILKFALLYAMQARHERIQREDLARAGIVGGYLTQTALHVPAGVQEVRTPRMEAKILEFFSNRSDSEWLPASVVHRFVGGRIKAQELRSSLYALVDLGRLELDEKQIRGNMVKIFRESR